MSKETFRGTDCVCGQRFAFPEYHWPHCPMNPANMSTKTHGAGNALLTSLQAKFTKAELAEISKHGPVRDERIGRRGKKAGAKR